MKDNETFRGLFTLIDFTNKKWTLEFTCDIGVNSNAYLHVNYDVACFTDIPMSYNSKLIFTFLLKDFRWSCLNSAWVLDILSLGCCGHTL